MSSVQVFDVTITDSVISQANIENEPEALVEFEETIPYMAILEDMVNS
jgi:hypothetical protein